jgi:hypothetical protein
MTTTWDLYDYDTAELIRPATVEELWASARAARRDGGRGVINVADQGDRPCYVVGDVDLGEDDE